QVYYRVLRSCEGAAVYKKRERVDTLNNLAQMLFDMGDEDAALKLFSQSQELGENQLGATDFFSSRRRHTICYRDWSSDVCSSDLSFLAIVGAIKDLRGGLKRHPALNVQQPSSMRVPYGLAIAMGALYCVGNVFWWR